MLQLMLTKYLLKEQAQREKLTILIGMKLSPQTFFEQLKKLEIEATPDFLMQHFQHLRQDSESDSAVKIEALLWVGAALFIFFYGDGRDNLLDLALHDEMVNRTWLYVGLGAAAVNGAIFLYLAVWLSWWQGKREWFREAPYAVPAGTVCGIVTAFSAIVAFWPVLTWRAPVYAGVLFMGFLMHFHFHPSFGGGPPKED